MAHHLLRFAQNNHLLLTKKGFTMFVNARMAFFSLTRRKGRVLSRIISLTLGLALGVFLLSFVNYRYNYDNFLPDNERIYKIFTNTSANGGGGIDQLTFSPLAHTLMRDCPEVESGTRIFGPMTFAWTGEDKSEHQLTAYACDSLFFKVLDFGLLTGDAASLGDFNNMLLSEEAAKRIFGNEDPVGKVLKDNLDYPKTVVGVFRDIPYNTSLGHFDAIVSEYMHQTQYDKESSWDNSNEYYSYVKLRPGTSAVDVEAWMNNAMVDKYGLREMVDKYQLRLMMVPVKRAEVMVGTRAQYMDFIAIITVLVLILCALNYALLSISSLVNRSRTIAVMRCTVADKKDIRIQFMWETLFVMLVSGALSAVLIFLMKDYLSTTIDCPVADLFNPKNIWVTVLVIMALFVGSSLIPASIFASVPTTVAFKGISDNRKGWKRALLFFEITCVSFALAFLLVSVRQIKMLTEGDIGYNQKNMLYFSLFVHGGDALFNAERDLENLPCVEKVGTALSLPCYGYMPSHAFIDEKSGEMSFPFVREQVSDSYFDVMEMQILEGRMFNDSSSLDEVVVNRHFLEMAGMTEDPLGRIICQGDNEGNIVQKLRIIGVVNDVRSTETGRYQPIVYSSIRESLKYEDWYYGGFRTMIRLADLNQANIDAVMKKVKDDYETMDKYALNIYEETYKLKMRGELHFRNLLMTVSILATILAAIGLVGYISDELKRRRKEVAIRKLCGSSLWGIMKIVVRDFSYLAIPSILVGEILAVVASGRWLMMFEYRLPLDWWMFALTGAAVLVAIYIVEALLTLQLASVNPVESFKTE